MAGKLEIDQFWLQRFLLEYLDNNWFTGLSIIITLDDPIVDKNGVPVIILEMISGRRFLISISEIEEQRDFKITDKCPICGRSYKSIRRYKNGHSLIIHASKPYSRRSPHFKVTDGCRIPPVGGLSSAQAQGIYSDLGISQYGKV